MQLEEEGAENIRNERLETLSKIKVLWQKLKKSGANELTTMQKEEEYQKLVEHKNEFKHWKNVAIGSVY